jgi:membrane protein DedA with SNARE-associated domain
MISRYLLLLNFGGEMFAETIIFLETILIAYGPLGVFLGSIVEEVIAPIPSTLVIMGTSFIILKDNIISWDALFKMFLYIVIPASFGVTIGSLVVYSITYFAGKPFLERWGKYLGISWEDIEKAEKRFKKSKSDGILLFMVRAFPIIPSVAINAFCGFVRFEIKRYLIITFLGTFVRASILGFIGWQFGSLYQKIAAEISYLEEISFLIIFLGIILFIIYKKKFQKRNDSLR